MQSQTNWSISTTGTTVSSVTYGANGLVVQETLYPNGSKSQSTSQNGLQLRQVNFDSAGNILSSETYEFDAFQRLVVQTDLRNGSTTFGYDESGRKVSTTLPAEAQGNVTWQVLLTEYDLL